ncbi:MAG: GNAT family N-acetyltransferase [Rhodospirillales bacterium]|nr:GNAT family N-acetyltransferase [Rhodospirillales bacterium]
MQVLATPRLRLRARTLDDLDAILAMDADADVRRFMGGPPHANAHRAEVRANIIDGRPSLRRWVIEWRDRPGFLGQCGLSLCHLPGCTALTWRLGRAHWGRGIASEAVGALLRHAREDLGLRSFVAFIHADNQASQRVADKVGLRPAGETVLHGYRQRVYRLD